MIAKGILILGGVLFLYAFLSLIRPLALRWWWKMLLCLPLGATAFKYTLLHVLCGGSFFRPAVPMWLDLLSLWLFMGLIITVAGLLVLDLVRLPFRLFLGRKTWWRSFRNRVNGVLLLAALGLTAWGMHQAFALPQVREITISLPRLQVPVRLAMLTDLHADRYKQADFFREVVNRTNALQVDAVVITGDFQDGHPYELAPALAPLRDLKSRWGTFAVSGNHDYFTRPHAWHRYLSSLGIRFLDNAYVLPGPGHLVLAGITDPAATRGNSTPPDIIRALQSAPAGKPVVLLAHQPGVWNTTARHGVDLQLSGHTHGGHAPGLRHLIAHFNEGLVQGLYHKGNTQLYISNGTSLWSGFPLRLGTPAEITLITLVPEQKQAKKQ